MVNGEGPFAPDTAYPSPQPHPLADVEAKRGKLVKAGLQGEDWGEGEAKSAASCWMNAGASAKAALEKAQTTASQARIPHVYLHGQQSRLDRASPRRKPEERAALLYPEFD